jgi:hypothetical protein
MPIGSEFLRFNKQQEYVIVDYETENLNTLHGLPWQVSFLVCDLKGVKEEHDYFPYFEDLSMSKGAASITRFDYSEYKSNGKDPKEVLSILDSYIYDPKYVVVFQNGIPFDSMIHQVFRRKMGKTPDYSYLNRCIDTNAIAKAWKHGIKPPLFGTPDFLPFQYRMLGFYQKGVKTNLTQLGKDFQIEFDYTSTHRGINDIRLNYLVFKKLLNVVEI